MIRAVLVFAFLWVCSFLLHELMHIKGGGLRNTGMIFVGKFDMAASLYSQKHDDWFYLSGGFLTGIVFAVASMLTVDVLWRFSLLTIGLVQVIYGGFELLFLRRWGGSSKRYLYGRYLIYFGVTLFMLLMCLKL